MNLRSVCLAFVSAALTLTAVAAQPNKFDLISTDSGKPVGHASYSIDKTKNGYKVHSTFDALVNTGGVNDLPVSPGVGYSRAGGGSFADVQYSYDYTTGPDGRFLSGYAQSSLTQTMLSMSVNKSRDQITVRQTRAGTDYGSQTVTLPKPDFLVLPDYDPGSIQLFITTALTSPRDNNQYLVVVPANPDLGQSNNTAGFVTLKSEPDAKGTLNGNAINLKHYSIEFRGGKTDIYTDDSGNLMDVLMVPLHTTYVRSKFVLTPAS